MMPSPYILHSLALGEYCQLPFLQTAMCFFTHYVKEQLLTLLRGKSLAITASGTLEEDIEEGAKVHVEVSYGFIKLINQELDLCEYAGQVDLECPLKKGDLKLSKTVDLPNEIPPGKYNVVADVYTKDKETITCLKASVVFSRG